MPRRIALDIDNLTPEGAQALIKHLHEFLDPVDDLVVDNGELVIGAEDATDDSLVDDIVDHTAAFRAGHAAALLGRQVA